MEITGEHHFSTPRDRVWELLLDPAILQQCLPGAENLVEVGPEEYEATHEDRRGGDSWHLSGTGQDHRQGRAERLPHGGRREGPGGADLGRRQIALSEDGDGTRVELAGNANVRGTLARVGGRVMQPAAKMIVGQFFTCLESKIGGVASSRFLETVRKGKGRRADTDHADGQRRRATGRKSSHERSSCSFSATNWV